jgi:DNA-binding transcriptional regulator/RsmH inhibitor MraZ
MPNAARPLRTHPARAAADASASTALAHATSPAVTSAETASATPTTGSLPSAWGAAGQQLLLEQSAALGTRSPINVALLESTTGADTTASVDLSAIWTLAEERGRPAARIAIRRLDPKGRLMLPLTLSEEIRVDVLAECDGPVLTLFLPGCDSRPALERVVAPLPLDSRGRLTVKQATRNRVGWTSGTEVLIAFDLEKQTVTLTAASTLEDSVFAALDALRPSARATQADVANTETTDDENVHYLPTAGSTTGPDRPAEKSRR